MEEYRNERTIEKLDPIPVGWNHDTKSKFLDHGFLAIAGETPAAVMRTKRIDLDTLMSNLPGVIVWLGNSESRSSDGVFLLNESKSSETHREDKNLVCSDGILRAVHGGWYHIQATWIMNGGGANNEYRHAILSLSVADSLRSEMQATMDLSVSGNNYCTITAVVYVDDEDSSIKFTISGLSNDALVTSRLDNISVHKLAAVTSAANIHAEGELEQKQSDWNESDPNKVEYIKNKPDLSVYATTDYVDAYEPRVPAKLFSEPPIYGGHYISAGNTSLYLPNIRDGFSLMLIGLRPDDGSHVNAGDIFEVVTNGFPAFGDSELLSMGLFKMVGHPAVGSDGPVTFRRLTTSLAPRSMAGVRNDGGVPPYGQQPVADNPIRFTLDEGAQFDNGELLYLGIALAFDNSMAADQLVFICAAPQLPVDDYNNPINWVNPVYYAYGQSDKIGVDGFTAREFTIASPNGGHSADFAYATTFAGGYNAYAISTSGISDYETKTYPAGFTLVKQ